MKESFPLIKQNIHSVNYTTVEHITSNYTNKSFKWPSLPDRIVPVDFSPPFNHKNLPVTITTCVRAHRCSHSCVSAMGVFSFMLSFLLTVQAMQAAYHSVTMHCNGHKGTWLQWHFKGENQATFLFDPSQMYLFFGIPVQLILSFFSSTCTTTFPLIYWGTYIQIHPKIDSTVYLGSLLSNQKDLPLPFLCLWLFHSD